MALRAPNVEASAAEFTYRFNGRELAKLFSITLARLLNREALLYQKIVTTD